MRRLRADMLVAALVLCVACLFLVTSVAFAALTSPSVFTGEAAELTLSSAVVKGSVTPHNQTTSYYFQYGQTAAYGGVTPLAVAGAGTASIRVSASIAALSPYTTYHYRLVAVNPSGITNGQDRIFTTKKIPLIFKLSAPSRVIFGNGVSVSGTLSGTGAANNAVVLQAKEFPFLGAFKTITGPILTSPVGAFVFPAVPLPRTTQLRVSTLEKSPASSAVLMERVGALVTLHVRSTGRAGFVRLYGTLRPAQSLALVSFQLVVRGHRPKSIGSVVVKGRTRGRSFNRFSRVVRIRHAGLYRAFAEVSGGAQVSSYSRPVLIG